MKNKPRQEYIASDEAGNKVKLALWESHSKPVYPVRTTLLLLDAVVAVRSHGVHCNAWGPSTHVAVLTGDSAEGDFRNDNL